MPGKVPGIALSKIIDQPGFPCRSDLHVPVRGSRRRPDGQIIHWPGFCLCEQVHESVAPIQQSATPCFIGQANNSANELVQG